MDFWLHYKLMLHSRLFEECVRQLYYDGMIAGEMHLGIGEEGIAAGVISQLSPGDALALDHRGTPQLLMWGIEPAALLKEFLGGEDGLCGGQGGHMHLFSAEHLSASSGIVGASGPAGVGFALAAKRLRPGTIATAWFGEGATNEGAMMEAWNLAVVWQLPLLFICKDNDYSITTRSQTVRGGYLPERARSFGLRTLSVNGADIEEVWLGAKELIEHARSGNGPVLLHARCRHFEGHFIGMQSARMVNNPVKEMTPLVPGIIKALFRGGGAPLSERLRNVRTISGVAASSRSESQAKVDDPILRTRFKLQAEDEARLTAIEVSIQAEIKEVLDEVLSANTVMEKIQWVK